MTSDLAKLMEKIDLLQSEALPEPVIEIEETTVHPLLQAMQELREEGVIDEYVNKDTVTPGFKKEKWIMGGKYKLVATARDRKNDKDVEGLIIKVIDPEDTSVFRPGEVGSVRLIVKGDGSYDDRALSASLLGVDDDHQRKGLASAMYQFARELGNDIMPSNSQTDMGKAFWKGGAGVGKDFPEELPPEPEAKQEPEVEPEAKKPFWKRLFKEDELEEEIAYHGTTDDIAEFYPLTHFGTEKAAKDRMTYKKIKDGKIYKVDLNIKNPLTIKDFPGIHYDRLYAFELKNKKLISQEEMEAITFIQDKAELRKALLAKLKELGIDGFVYKNRYEDKGHISYVIVDPSQVKVLSVEPAAEAVSEEVAFNQPRRQLNIPELIKRGAIFITHPHGPDGWETDRPDWDFSLITLQNILQKSPNWVSDYKKYISNNKKLTQDFINRISDEKYQQILWSINKLNIPDNVAFIDKLNEASPDTLEGSFTPDLVESKTWLAEMLAKGLKGKNAGTIYVLGSWYGNMGIFLQQAGVKFDKLVLVEPDEEALMRSKDLLQQIGDEGKLILIHQKAEDVVYEKPGVVINTSCNETGPVFLTKLPDNMLCLLQARNNNENTLFPTEDEEDFIDYFPLETVYYTGKKHLEDPEVNYVRYMKIGRTGKKASDDLNEDVGGNYLYHATSAGGLSAILNSGQVNAASGPQVATRAQTKLPTVSMTRDWGYASGKNATQQMGGIGRDAILVFDRSRIENNYKTLGTSQSSDVRGLAYNPNFGGKEQNQSLQARTIAKRKYDYAQQSDPETKAAYTKPKAGGEFEEAIVVPKGALPTKGTLIGFYVNPESQLTKDPAIMNNPLRLVKTGPNKFINASKEVAETISTGQGGGSAGVGGGQMVGGPTTYEQEYDMFKRKGARRITAMTNEALDSSYPYRNSKRNPGNDFYFDTEDGQEYKVEFDSIWGDDVTVSFAARGQGDEHKIGLTGTGNSRKIFGTVIKIVKDYITKANPEIIVFSANNSEPSRVRLYNMLASQVNKELPNYNFTDAFSNGGLTTYYLTRDGAKIPTSTKVKAKAGKALDAVFEEES